jgi:phosphomannomutase/phosphoglucomutase
MVSGKIQKRLFGTNGVRGIVGSDMTPELSLKIGAAFGTMRRGCIAVGRDTRTSGECLANALKAGLMASGCDVVDVGIIPTPGLQYIIKGRFDGGAIITASHNPPEYNGIKIIDSDGTEMADEGIIQLEKLLFEQKFKIAVWDQVGSEQSSPHLTQEYIKGVINHFPRQIGNGMVVAVDPGFGAGTITTPPLLSAFGCKVFTINATLGGSYSGRLPEPSQEGLEGLASLVKSVRAAFGVAHDGDADRAVFIDEKLFCWTCTSYKNSFNILCFSMADGNRSVTVF